MSIEPPVQLESPVQPLHSSPGCSPCPSSPSIMATAMMSPPAATTVSASAPEIHTRRTLSASPVAPSPSLDAALVSSPRNSSPDALASVNNSPNNASTSSDGSEPDPQIVEALRSKDRIYVLKLGEQMESLINERRARIDLTPATSYQRLLVHRCSAYYRLIPETDPGTKNIIVYFRTESRIPSRRISELVPAEESAQPAFKIMRRSTQDGPKSRHNSQTGSVAGEDADLSDIEPSEAGSIGGRSNATGGSKRHMTLEERAAAYNEARSRIFMGFEEKEKEKEKDMSANSSTFSLVSGSGSTSGGRSSGGDADDSASSAATESEWSGPVTRDKRDSRRGGSGGSSSRSMRSSGASYNNGSGSSRNSRATSPSFTYASLYDGPPTSSLDPTQYGQQSPPGYIAHCYYPYGQPPGQPYMPPYSYYPPYTWGPPPQHPAPHHSDPASPAGGEPMYPHPQTSAQQVAYVNPYMWLQSPPSHIPQQQSTSSLGLNLPPQTSHTSPPQPQNVPQYLAYTPAPPHYNPYAFTPYQPTSPPVYPPDQQMPAPPPIQGQPLWLSDMTTHTPTGHTNSNGNSAENNHHIRASSRNSGSHHGGGSSKRGMPRRGAWSYGPGAGSGGYTWNVAGLSGGGGGNDVVGPRLSSSVRRISGTSSGSGSAGTRTPGDEASSTASSSTTSSSSRHTYTSTSSKHPLPPRPDWAVGLKAQPSLAPPRHHDHSNPNSRTMSPARISGQGHLNQQHQPQPALQPNDFPPLSSAPERRLPTVGGAWTNTSSMRSILMPAPQGTSNMQGNALVHYPNSQPPTLSNHVVTPQMDDQESGFDRPPPKGNAELFNPKASRSSNPSLTASNGDRTSRVEREEVEAREVGKQEKVQLVGEAVASAILVEKVGTLTLEDGFIQLDGPSTEKNGCPSVAMLPTVDSDGTTHIGLS